MDRDSKKARRLRARIVLIDETGLLTAPLVRRTLAPRGQTPVPVQRAAKREKVSAVAAPTLSPFRRRLNLFFRTFPRDFVDSEKSAEFLRGLLRQVPGPVIVVWDGGHMHQGDPIREPCRRFPRLHLERLPPYAPELNPVEHLWNHLKYTLPPNFAPTDADHLNTVVRRRLHRIRRRPGRLKRFLHASALPLAPPALLI